MLCFSIYLHFGAEHGQMVNIINVDTIQANDRGIESCLPRKENKEKKTKLKLNYFGFFLLFL